MELGEIMRALDALDQVSPAAQPMPGHEEKGKVLNQLARSLPGQTVHPFTLQLLQQLLLGTARNQMGIKNNPDDFGSLMK